MKHLGIDLEELNKIGGIHTAREISQQPELWKKVWKEISSDKTSIINFLEPALANSKRIILTGAGTSAFIGLSLRGIFQRNTGIITEAIATTDLVSNPNDFFLEDTTTLMVSFARSGNSPESVAAIELADQICKTCYHIIITCNEDGALAHYNSKPNKFVITLPKESNDISLAMTSSYSSMLLTGLLIAKIEKLESLQSSIETCVEYAQNFIASYAKDLRKIAEINFSRAVFLGSGCFYGTATESHLKLQELTDGKVICKKDSYLGFRHGPKCVIDESTLVVYLLSSSDEHALKYEKDLIESMQTSRPSMIEISVSESVITDFNFPYMFHFSKKGKQLDDDFLALCYILPAQILGFFKSWNLGLQPDSPSVSGDITRVVQGVNIYSIV